MKRTIALMAALAVFVSVATSNFAEAKVSTLKKNPKPAIEKTVKKESKDAAKATKTGGAAPVIAKKEAKPKTVKKAESKKTVKSSKTGGAAPVVTKKAPVHKTAKPVSKKK